MESGPPLRGILVAIPGPFNAKVPTLLPEPGKAPSLLLHGPAGVCQSLIDVGVKNGLSNREAVTESQSKNVCATDLMP